MMTLIFMGELLCGAPTLPAGEGIGRLVHDNASLSIPNTQYNGQNPRCEQVPRRVVNLAPGALADSEGKTVCPADILAVCTCDGLESVVAEGERAMGPPQASQGLRGTVPPKNRSGRVESKESHSPGWRNWQTHRT